MAQLTITLVTATIAKDETLSTPIDATTGRIDHIVVPGDWDPDTNITFQASSDGVAYFNLYDSNGNEIMIGVVPGTMVKVGQHAIGGAWIKLRSGRHDADENDTKQTGNRLFSIAIAT